MTRITTSLEQILCSLSPEQFNLFQRPTQKYRRLRRGTRGGLLVRLRRRAHHPPLLSILVANVQSLDNKVDALRARISFQRDIGATYFVSWETWLSQDTLSESVKPAGFSVHRADRNKYLSRKQKGGGVRFKITTHGVTGTQVILFSRPRIPHN